ncbi:MULTISPECIES: YqeB family protein [Gracilibacillus]|uniref:YqeB family protein n=1 Tax=Gracilibacillus TaxID=74385 RepID=UPI000824D0FC|nr:MULTISPECIES: 50S ribosomal protein L29 [Gracilibacillus]
MQQETVVGLSKLDKGILIVLSPLIGALLGWFIPVIADWLVMVPFIPFDPFFRWIAAWDNVWVPVIGLVIGLIAGVIFIIYAFSESLKMTMTDQGVTLKKLGQQEYLEREALSAVYLDRKEIVFLGGQGQELYRGESEAKVTAIEKAMQDHRFPWQRNDPYAGHYQRWVADHPDFSSAINALLSAREKALQADDSKEANTLRKDLAAEGIVIHDEDKRQYVRIAGGTTQ